MVITSGITDKHTATLQTVTILLRYRDLLAAGIVKNRVTLRRWMGMGEGARKDDLFPLPIRLGAGKSGSVAWKAAEVEAWLTRRANVNNSERVSA